MGCQTSNVLDFKEGVETKIVANSDSSIIKHNASFFIEKQRKEFPDMEEWEGERYKGIGIKRMKGYKCTLQIDKLNQKREEFWNLRNSHGAPNYKTWRIINQACVYDEFRANVIMEEYNLTTAEGCINHIIDKNGTHYIVPNYCINDPYFEKEFKVKDDIKQVDLTLNLYEVALNKTTTVNTNNLITGEKLKKIFCEQNNISMDDYKIRMFFAGNEILDEHYIYQYNIKNDFKIQVMKSPKPKENE